MAATTGADIDVGQLEVDRLRLTVVNLLVSFAPPKLKFNLSPLVRVKSPCPACQTPTQSSLLYISVHRMSVQNLNSFGPSVPYRRLPHLILSPDPFADEGDPLGNSQDVGSQLNYIHIRIQQRNGRKTLTTLQGLPKGELCPIGETHLLTCCRANRVRCQETSKSFQEGNYLHISFVAPIWGYFPFYH
jgi:hypothetical protein